MSDKITLLYNVQNEVTVLPNKFIDEYMIKADGEYVKIYLLILRLQGCFSVNVGKEKEIAC